MITELQFSSTIAINPLDIIPKSYLDLIKLKDKHPKFATYVVGVEGTSRPKVLESGMAKIINWSKNAIKQVSDKIKLGINCIVGHTKDNQLRDEKIIGVVSGVSTREINGKLSSVIAVYFPNGSTQDYDVISMESDVEINPEDDSIAEVLDVKRFALGKSSEVSPAFSGAVKVGEIQCFEPVTDKQISGGNPRMNFNEVKQAVKDLNIFPYQLWDIKEIIGHYDKSKGIFYGGIDNRLTDHLNTQFPIKQFMDDISIAQAKIKELEESNTTFLKEKETLVKDQASIKLRKVVSENSTLDPKQKAYIEKKIAKYTPKAGTDEEINGFISEQLEDYKEFVALHQDKFTQENAKLLPDSEPSINTKGIPKGYI
jgi:FtsZ-binding cell division protein ZapB